MKTNVVTPLQVDDEEFIVASMIERCPKTMMLRELVKNALEAAEKSDKKVIYIGTTMIDSVAKLTIWNSGPGMDDRELLSVCNIAASLGKEKSLTENFGMGAKVASLPSNQRGMRYRSCKNGRVHELILGKRDGIYGIIRRPDPETGDLIEIFEVTVNDRPTDFDWTEVVLLGNEKDQDTVKDPYNGDPKQQNMWLANYLYHRFYRFPDGVKFTLLKGTHKLDGNRVFETIPERLRYFQKHETINLPDRIRIHYLFDAPYNKQSGTGHNQSISGAVATDVSTCAVVHKNEMYDVKTGRSWALDAPIFGIQFGAKHISVHIELPDNYSIIPEAYREFLRYGSGEQARVEAKDFAELVRNNRPQWLRELIASLTPQGATSEDIRDELQNLLNELRVKRLSPRLTPEGKTPVTTGDGPAAAIHHGASENDKGERTHIRPSDLMIAPEGAKRADIFRNLERAPKITELLTEEQVEDKGLRGRAGKYYKETGELFVNMLYPAIAEMQSVLEAQYASVPDPEVMRTMAATIAKKSMILRIGRTVVYALAKQLNKDWSQKDLEAAASPESLTMAADNYADSLQTARRQMGIALRPTKAEAPVLA